uniref:Uncharacterized protein n=1 Tax=Salix viminalis TaxID=40686 RepID=A0A6N2LYK5_SALVM
MGPLKGRNPASGFDSCRKELLQRSGFGNSINMVFEAVDIDDFGWCHVQVCVTFSIFLMDLLVSRNYRKEISGFILMDLLFIMNGITNILFIAKVARLMLEIQISITLQRSQSKPVSMRMSLQSIWEISKSMDLTAAGAPLSVCCSVQ